MARVGGTVIDDADVDGAELALEDRADDAGSVFGSGHGSSSGGALLGSWKNRRPNKPVPDRRAGEHERWCLAYFGSTLSRFADESSPSVSSDFTESLKFRMPSPRPLPSFGSLFTPKITMTITRMISNSGKPSVPNISASV
jgi:hypothetical protein